jgi:hypothetical protein
MIEGNKGAGSFIAAWFTRAEASGGVAGTAVDGDRSGAGCHVD